MDAADVERAIARSRRELAGYYEMLVEGKYPISSRKEVLAKIRELKWELSELEELRRMLAADG